MKLKVRHLLVVGFISIAAVIAIIIHIYFNPAEVETKSNKFLAQKQAYSSEAKPSYVDSYQNISKSTAGHSDESPTIEINYRENLTLDEEAFTEQQIAILEMLEQEQQNDVPENEQAISRMTGQLAELFMDYDQDYVQLLDLDCISSACRVTLLLADQNAQDAALNSISSQIGWMQNSYADIELLPDDSRIAMLLILRTKVL